LRTHPLKHAEIRALEALPPFDDSTGITAMPPQNCKSDAPQNSLLPALRFEVPEAAQILRMSRAQLYNRIHEGSIKPQKDGTRTYITRVELERYVESCSISSTA
jgi:excisionase family DNA binding protein